MNTTRDEKRIYELDDLAADRAWDLFRRRILDFATDYAPLRRAQLLAIIGNHRQLLREQADYGDNENVRAAITKSWAQMVEWAHDVQLEASAEPNGVALPSGTDLPAKPSEYIDRIPALSEVVRQKRVLVGATAARGQITLSAVGLEMRYPGNSRFFLKTDPQKPLDFRVGEVTGVIGTNGSGKSTLLSALAGEKCPRRGTITFADVSATKLNWFSAKRRMAYVPQRPPRWSGTVGDSLRLRATLAGVPPREVEIEVQVALERFGLSEYDKSRWHELSGGFLTRFELARAIVSRPVLLIMDEPLAALDPVAQEIFLKDVTDLSVSEERPMSVLLSSQHIEALERTVSKTILVADGVAKVLDEEQSKEQHGLHPHDT